MFRGKTSRRLRADEVVRRSARLRHPVSFGIKLALTDQGDAAAYA